MNLENNKRLGQFQGKVQRNGTILSTVGNVAGAWGSGMDSAASATTAPRANLSMVDVPTNRSVSFAGGY